MKKITEIWLAHDVRTKLLLALLFSIAAIMSDSIISLTAFFALGLLFCLLARVKAAYLIKRCFMVNIFLLFVWLALPWQPDGQGSLRFYAPAMWLALAITLKCNAIFLAWTGLFWRVNPYKLLLALAAFHIPNKLLTLFFLFCRFTWTLKREYVILRNAMRARGFKPGLNRHTLRSMAHLITTMLVLGFERGQRVHNAMRARGFNGRFYFPLHGLAWQKRDWLLAACVATAILAACWLQFIGTK